MEENYNLWDNLKKCPAFVNSFKLGEMVWMIVEKWPYFAKITIGEQFIRAIDSIAANLAEGYGRYHFLDKIKFYYYSRGSALEGLTWLAKSYKRNLLNEKDKQSIQLLIQTVIKDINFLVSRTRSQI